MVIFFSRDVLGCLKGSCEFRVNRDVVTLTAIAACAPAVEGRLQSRRHDSKVVESRSGC